MRYNLRKLSRTIRIDRMLRTMGLQRRLDPITDVVIPSMTLFAVGALFGASTAVLLAPKSGPALRKDLAEGAKSLTRRLSDGSRRASAGANEPRAAAEP